MMTTSFTLGPREVYLMRHSYERHKRLVMLPAMRFFQRMGLDFNEVRKGNRELLLLEIQREITKLDKSLVIGLDIKRDNVCWYVVPNGQQPMTTVPFYTNMPEWINLKHPEPVKELDQQIWHDCEEHWKNIRRAIAGVPLPRKAWYQRPSRRK